MTDKPTPHRHIKSFVRREGRITPGQRKALETNSEKFILPTDQGLLDWPTIFGRTAPVALEIGFGMGDSLFSMAQTFPEKNFIGVEVYRPGIGTLITNLENAQLNNVRIFATDAMLVIPNCIPDHSLDTVYVFFPDPWPKTRHHKRRIIQPAFVELLCQKLVKNGMLHLATDWEEYAYHMLEVLSTNPNLQNLAGPGEFAKDRGDRPASKYEKRGQRLGHGVWDLRFTHN